MQTSTMQFDAAGVNGDDLQPGNLPHGACPPVLVGHGGLTSWGDHGCQASCCPLAWAKGEEPRVGGVCPATLALPGVL